MQWVWVTLGIIALVLGAIGIVTPLLPTVPFLLLAAFCFSRSSDRLHNWLLSHPTLGPPIEHWNRSGAIKRRAKLLASGSMLLAFSLSIALGVRPILLGIQGIVLIGTAIFIWSRPEG